MKDNTKIEVICTIDEIIYFSIAYLLIILTLPLILTIHVFINFFIIINIKKELNFNSEYKPIFSLYLLRSLTYGITICLILNQILITESISYNILYSALLIMFLISKMLLEIHIKNIN